MISCEYCKKELTSKSNLKMHQTRTKYCLEIQKKINPSICISKEQCKYCDKSFQNKHRRDSHENICSNSLTQKIILFEEEINTLKIQSEKDKCEINTLKIQADHNKDEINNLKIQNQHDKEEISNLKIQHEKEKVEIYSTLFNKDQDFILSQSMRGSVTNNNYKAKTMTLNTLDLSTERIEAVKDTYNLEYYEKGGAGQADWVKENLLHDNYICTDKARSAFMFKNSENDIVHDIRAKKLKAVVKTGLSSKIKEFKKRKCEEMAEIDDDNNELAEKNSALYRDNIELGKSFDDRLIECTYVKL